jgi:D-alanyl-D-alanine dipeptidase
VLLHRRRWALPLSALLCLGLAAQVPPSDPSATRPPDLVPIQSVDATLRVDLKYAGADNFMGRAMYPAGAQALLNREPALALARANAALRPKGFALLVWDAYRPWSVTKAFWEATPPEKREFVADPAKGSVHNRGCAVDLTLFDLRAGRPAEMPSGFDEMTERASPGYSGGKASARANRDLLRTVMESVGFTVYPTEWWHFDYRSWKEYPVLDTPFTALSRPAGGDRASAAATTSP